MQVSLHATEGSISPEENRRASIENANAPAPTGAFTERREHVNPRAASLRRVTREGSSHSLSHHPTTILQECFPPTYFAAPRTCMNSGSRISSRQRIAGKTPKKRLGPQGAKLSCGNPSNFFITTRIQLSEIKRLEWRDHRIKIVI